MDIKADRYTAHYTDDFVVVLIGLRINHWRRVTQWWPVLRGAFRMVDELRAMPDSPLLQSRAVVSLADRRLFFFVQHWRSVDELEKWANDPSLLHKPAWQNFFRRTGTNGHVGVWHEVYSVPAGQFEAIYANMPRISLAEAGSYQPLRPASKLRTRLGDGQAT